MRGSDEQIATRRLLAARCRYAALRDALPCDCPIDRDLHAELTEAIRTLDAKISVTDRPDHAEPPRCGVLSPGGQPAGGQAQAPRHRSAR